MGGEVVNSLVYGEVLTQSITVTEGYDVTTQQWERMADLVYPRHATQALVSGNGVYIASGASNWGAAPPQTHMEYFGEDNPQGMPLVASSLVVEDVLFIPENSLRSLSLLSQTGNTGFLLEGLEVQGANAGEFGLNNPPNLPVLIAANGSLDLEISNSATAGTKSASLLITYNGGQTLTVALTNEFALAIADQNNDEGDEVSLATTSETIDPAYEFSATGLPAGLSIDSATGLISGTLSLGSSVGSPYVVEVSLTDTSTSTVLASVVFNWVVTDPTVLTFAAIADQSSLIDDVVDLGVVVTGGDVNEPLSFVMSGAPAGLSIDSSSGQVTGTIDASAAFGGPSLDGIHQVTITASRLGSADVDYVFTWAVSSAPSVYYLSLIHI